MATIMLPLFGFGPWLVPSLIALFLIKVPLLSKFRIGAGNVGSQAFHRWWHRACGVLFGRSFPTIDCEPLPVGVRLQIEKQGLVKGDAGRGLRLALRRGVGLGLIIRVCLRGGGLESIMNNWNHLGAGSLAVAGHVLVTPTLRTDQVQSLVFDMIPVVPQPKFAHYRKREVNFDTDSSETSSLDLECILIHFDWPAYNRSKPQDNVFIIIQ